MVAGETRGGATTELDFFAAAVNSAAVPARAAAPSEAAATVAGRGGVADVGPSFWAVGVGMTAVLLAGVGGGSEIWLAVVFSGTNEGGTCPGTTGTDPVGLSDVTGAVTAGVAGGATGTEPVGFLAAGANGGGNGTGTTGTDPVGGFDAVGRGAEGRCIVCKGAESLSFGAGETPEAGCAHGVA